MEAEYLERLGKLYRQAQKGGHSTSLGMVESAMNHLLSAEAAVTSMMVAESLAIETLKPET